MAKVEVRKGMPSVALTKAEFSRRIRERFYDPAFDSLQVEIGRIIDAAWDGYHEYRKSPRTRKAGRGFADPDHDLPVEWLNTRDAIARAERAQKSAASRSRILLVNGSSRSDQSCPGEMSKTFRLVEIARREIERERGFEAEVLDLSLLAAQYGRQILPCKACVSTAMPLCHWPCSCYPNHAMGQVNDWMNEIYPMWVEAHGIMIVTPVYWYQVPAGLKAMMDRLVCADGGNPDPSSTHGKVAEEAKAIELAGWDYPKHLAGRLFSVVVQGDAVGAEGVRRGLEDWLTDMELIPAGAMAIKDGYIGYEKPYATSHRELDADDAFQQDVRMAARTLARAIKLQAQGRMAQPDDDLQPAILK